MSGVTAWGADPDNWYPGEDSKVIILFQSEPAGGWSPSDLPGTQPTYVDSAIVGGEMLAVTISGGVVYAGGPQTSDPTSLGGWSSWLGAETFLGRLVFMSDAQVLAWIDLDRADEQHVSRSISDSWIEPYSPSGFVFTHAIYEWTTYFSDDGILALDGSMFNVPYFAQPTETTTTPIIGTEFPPWRRTIIQFFDDQDNEAWDSSHGGRLFVYFTPTDAPEWGVGLDNTTIYPSPYPDHFGNEWTKIPQGISTGTVQRSVVTAPYYNVEVPTDSTIHVHAQMERNHDHSLLSAEPDPTDAFGGVFLYTRDGATSTIVDLIESDDQTFFPVVDPGEDVFPHYVPQLYHLTTTLPAGNYDEVGIGLFVTGATETALHNWFVSHTRAYSEEPLILGVRGLVVGIGLGIGSPGMRSV